jgi:phosphoglycolate phosphatase-like HAD superfamily hydrolase
MIGLPIIVFDVNETLLDLESLAPTFERIFGDRLALRRWFAELILYSEALTLAGLYVPFTDIGGAVLKMVATTSGISISAADRAELTEKFASMPAHSEVPGALLKLKHAGFRLCTLTNGQCAPRRRTSAADDRHGPRGRRRQADRPLRQPESRGAGVKLVHGRCLHKLRLVRRIKAGHMLLATAA